MWPAHVSALLCKSIGPRPISLSATRVDCLLTYLLNVMTTLAVGKVGDKSKINSKLTTYIQAVVSVRSPG